MLNFKCLHYKPEELENFPSVWKREAIEDYILARYDRGDSINAIIEGIQKLNFDFNTKGIDWKKLTLEIIRLPREKLDGNFTHVYLFDEEIEELRKVESADSRKYLYLALIVHKWNNHSSGWVRYEREDFFKFWGMEDYKNSQKERIARGAIQHGISLRVVGQKNPVICYQVSFRKETGNIAAIYDSEEQIKDWWEWLAL